MNTTNWLTRVEESPEPKAVRIDPSILYNEWAEDIRKAGIEIPNNESYVDIDAICRLLGEKKNTLYRWTHISHYTDFPYYRAGKHLRFLISEVKEWLKQYHSSQKHLRFNR